MDLLDRLSNYDAPGDVIRSGGSAEGFRMRGSDVDQMCVDKKIKVVTLTPNDIQEHPEHTFLRLVRPYDVPPGYVKLIVLNPSSSSAEIRECMHEVSGDFYLSSTDYVNLHKNRSKSGVRHGPCVMEKTYWGQDHDMAYCFEFKSWPECANEWIERKRLHGWPSKQLVSTIKSKGCHIMAIGSNTLDERESSLAGIPIWKEDSFQWRISFSLAEIDLVRDFNKTQFLTYATLKMLNKELFSQDPFIHRCISSYSLKTLLFWTIEETSPDLWRPERFIRCVDICLKKLIEWTENGYYPNYFIYENNMLVGKVQEVDLRCISMKLSEIYKEGWRCLLHCPSLSMLKKDLEDVRYRISDPEKDFRGLVWNNRASDQAHEEANYDYLILSEVIAPIKKDLSIEILESELKNSLSLEVSENLGKYDIDVIRLRRFQNLCQLAIMYLNVSLTQTNIKTRRRYSYVRKALSYLHRARRSDVSQRNLTLATAYYCLGRFEAALTYINKYYNIIKKNLGCIHMHVNPHLGDCIIDPHYYTNICGKGYSIMEKISFAVAYDFLVYQQMPLIPVEIELEAYMMKTPESFLSFPPKLYSAFLECLCHFYLGRFDLVKGLSVTLNDMLKDIRRESVYLNYIMLAVTSVKLGKYDSALRYYCKAFTNERSIRVDHPDNQQWQARTSVLFYIAHLLRKLM